MEESHFRSVIVKRYDQVLCTECMGVGSIAVRKTDEESGIEYTALITCNECDGFGYNVKIVNTVAYPITFN